jgi:hypothetical protein
VRIIALNPPGCAQFDALRYNLPSDARPDDLLPYVAAAPPFVGRDSCTIAVPQS